MAPVVAHRTAALLLKPVNSIGLLCLLLVLPAYPLVDDLFTNERYYAEMMHISGVLSAQLLVLSLAITPATHVLRKWRAGKHVSQWLLRRRRHLGVASFGYAALHTIHYIREIWDLEIIYLEALDFEFSIGWIAMVILIPLAVTSNDTSLRALGRHWKTLHQLVYIAVIAMFTHWLLFDFFPDQALFWLALVLVPKAIQVSLRYHRKTRRNAHASEKLGSVPQ